MGPLRTLNAAKETLGRYRPGRIAAAARMPAARHGAAQPAGFTALSCNTSRSSGSVAPFSPGTMVSIR